MAVALFGALVPMVSLRLSERSTLCKTQLSQHPEGEIRDFSTITHYIHRLRGALARVYSTLRRISACWTIGRG